MLVGSELSEDGKLVMSHYNSEGKLNLVKIPIREDDMFNWVVSETPTNLKTWDGNFIRPSKTRRPSRFRLEELMFKYSTQSVKNMVHEFNKPKVAYLDIENYVNQNNDFTKAEDALYPINLISCLINNDVYILSTLPELSSDELSKMTNELNGIYKKFNTNYKLLYKFFNSESNLLKFFSQQLLPKLGFITGWNVIEYDWQYISNRCEKNGVDLFEKLPSKNKVGAYRIPMHTGMIDYIESMKSFKPFKDLENHKLDTVSKRVLGIGKLENPYSSFFEFIKDTYKFTLYNIIDSCAIQLVDQNIGMLGSCFAIGKISELEITRIFSSVYMTEMFLCREFYKRGIFLPDVKRKKQYDFKYKGAFVKEPIPGFYEMVGGFDFNSMYPNIAIQHNISPETYLGFADKIDPSQLPDKFTKTIKGTLFDTSQISATSSVLINYYDQRKSIQDEKTKLEQIFENLKNNK